MGNILSTLGVHLPFGPAPPSPLDEEEEEGWWDLWEDGTSAEEESACE